MIGLPAERSLRRIFSRLNWLKRIWIYDPPLDVAFYCLKVLCGVKFFFIAKACLNHHFLFLCNMQLCFATRGAKKQVRRPKY